MSYYLHKINPAFDVGFHSFRQFDDLISRAFGDMLFSTARHFDIDETEDAFLLTLELPGFKQADIDVTLDKTVLTVTAKRGERSYEQSVIVPTGVDPEKIGAKLEDGLLVLTLGKLPLLKPRKISIT